MAGKGEQKVQGKKDDNRDVISVIHQRLQASSDVEQLLQQAQQGGDQEVVEFLRDFQATQKDLLERAQNLLGMRRMRTQPPSPQKVVVVAHEQPAVDTSSPGAPTNAQVASGGHPSEDLADEQSMESFPASDAPAKY